MELVNLTTLIRELRILNQIEITFKIGRTSYCLDFLTDYSEGI